ncbi:MAG: MBL fold metallo-hydrolase, partial [Candidatus Hodarchaeota archaeon]
MIPITDKIFFIEGKSHGRYIFSNSLYINDDIKAIIDTGTGKSPLRKLKKDYVGNGAILIINSHVHEDHVCGNYIFKNSKIAIHRIEVPILENIDRLAELYGIDDPKYKEMNEQFFAIFNLRNYKADIK